MLIWISGAFDKRVTEVQMSWVTHPVSSVSENQSCIGAQDGGLQSLTSRGLLICPASSKIFQIRDWEKNLVFHLVWSPREVIWVGLSVRSYWPLQNGLQHSMLLESTSESQWSGFFTVWGPARSIPASALSFFFPFSQICLPFKIKLNPLPSEVFSYFDQLSSPYSPFW